VKLKTISHEFIDLAPPVLKEGVLYISYKYNAAVHNCCCGCGEKVMTPLSPAHWQVKVNKGKVTLHPSIGNWNMACKSHYWIRHGQVIWAGAMSQKEIAWIQERDRRDQAEYLRKMNVDQSGLISWVQNKWKRLKDWFFDSNLNG
jgi:hypothetical protein